MTIKEFSNLCGCNPQTIRYYDRMNLLKPVKVDDWTGYRYYDEGQAFDYVKIKNLQTAGFTMPFILIMIKIIFGCLKGNRKCENCINHVILV